jgi:hypothetical protein
MLDNQTRMRSMLDLIESVDQGKKINLNESIEEKVSEDVEDTHQDPESLAEEALDAAAAYIQDKLGITDGGPAGMFFSGENGITVEKIFADYVMFEYKNMEDDNSQTLDEGAMKRWLINQAMSMEKDDFVANAMRRNGAIFLSSEEAEEYWDNINGVDDEESDSNTRSNQFESVKSKTGKLPSMAHIKKMCKDGKTVAEICKMHPDCDRAELKQMVADCKDKLSESGEGNSSTREKSVSDSDEGYDKWDPKHPNFAKNYKKYKTSNPEGTLKSFIAHLKKGALAEGVRLNKFRQVADILKTLPENNRKILAKRHCKIFESNNSRFNSRKFMTYIGLNEGDVEDFLARGGKIQQGAPTDKKTPRARNSSYTDHSMRKGEQGRRGRGYQDYDPDDHQSRNDDIDYPTKDIRKPEYESKQMNETYGNGEIEVNFINSGTGQKLGMKTVQAGSITLDNYGRPVMKVSSPFASGNTLMANFDSKTGGWVVDLD